MKTAMNASPERTIRKFNPGTFQSDEELIEQFVVRQNELGMVMETLRSNIGSPSCQHLLIVAPRGRGKTMLLARTAAEIRTNSELSERLLPVRFMEESHEVFNMADFWLETLFHLAREMEGRDPNIARELRETHRDLAQQWRGGDLEERARSAVLETADRLNRQLVLMVENLQAMNNAVDDPFGWKLRKTLQTEPQIILLATATTRFKGLGDVEQPFFELFRTLHLDPLNTEECRHLWQMASGNRISGREIRPLEILTGGDPRLLVIISQFSHHRSMHDLMEDLVRLIDDHTEYFRTHLEGIPKNERRVYLALIDLWQPSTTDEITARARLDIRQVSTLLGRLAVRGAVTVNKSVGKRLYAATQRLYCIYYKLRRQRDEASIVRNLVGFMSAFFFGPDEILEIWRNMQPLLEKFPDIEEDVSNAIFGTLYNKWIADGDVDAPHLAMPVFEEVLKEYKAHPNSKIRVLVAWVLFRKGCMHNHLGNPREAIETLNELIFDFSQHEDQPEIKELVARALIEKGYILCSTESLDLAIETFDMVTERFQESDGYPFVVSCAYAMVFKGQVLGSLGRLDEVLEISDRTIGLYKNHTPGVHTAIALSLMAKASAHMKLSAPEAAIAAYGQIYEWFNSSNDLDVRRMVGTSLVAKADIQLQIHRIEGVLCSCDALEKYFGDLHDNDGVPFSWYAKWKRVKVLSAQGMYHQALDLFKRVYDQFDDCNKKMVADMLEVIDLVSRGVSESDIVGILLTDAKKSGKLQPLVVALEMRSGRNVRAPVEVMSVAEDISARIDKQQRSNLSSRGR